MWYIISVYSVVVWCLCCVGVVVGWVGCGGMGGTNMGGGGVGVIIGVVVIWVGIIWVWGCCVLWA